MKTLILPGDGIGPEIVAEAATMYCECRDQALRPGCELLE
jgi:isocitrate/isopropylmalate dehydrogenase